MLNYFLLDVSNSVGIRMIIHNLEIINHEATLKINMVEPPQSYTCSDGVA